MTEPIPNSHEQVLAELMRLRRVFQRLSKLWREHSINDEVDINEVRAYGGLIPQFCAELIDKILSGATN